MKPYALRFQPIFKERLWGGQKLRTVLHKPIPEGQIGESWELSDVEDNVSVIANGFLEGKNLRDALKLWREDLLGKENYEYFDCHFPLLIKFIDAREDLSIQVHPNDILAQKKHGCNGKTEMWYVMQAEKDAKLIVGFNQKTDKETYKKKLTQGRLTELMNYEKVRHGSTFFIKTGTIHAIGAGVLLAEIQQTSDITYRVYDFNRKDKNGQTRQLHTQEAFEALNFSDSNDFLVNYKKTAHQPNTMVACPYFTTRYWEIKEKQRLDLTAKDSFKIYVVVSGSAHFQFENQSENLYCGEVILVPAAEKILEIDTKGCEILEVFI